MEHPFAPAFAAVLFLSGCMANPAEPTAGPPGLDTGAPVAIVGAYRVAGVNGGEIDLDWAMTVEIGAAKIALESQCITPVWAYTYDQGALTTAQVAAPMCKRALLPEEEAILSAIDSAALVMRTSQNALELQGDGGTVTLFSQ